MAYSYALDQHNIPSLPYHALAVATLTGVALDQTARPYGFSVYVTSAGTVVASPLGGEADITLTYAAGEFPALIPFRCDSLGAAGTATVIIVY